MTSARKSFPASSKPHRRSPLFTRQKSRNGGPCSKRPASKRSDRVLRNRFEDGLVRKGDTPMRIQNLYADASGETHFREIEIEFAETGPDGTTSKLFPAKGIIFRTTPA